MRNARSLILGVCLASLTAAGAAQAAKNEAPAKPQTEMEAAFAAANAVAQHGPGEVKLGDQAMLELPKGFVYVPPRESGKLMHAMGNRTGDDLLGLVFPASDENWFVVIRFDPAGYIKDDDAKDWDADELLASLKAGTEEANKERAARGISAVEVVGWVEKPHYDAASHQLVWSIAAKDKGQPDTADQGINYNTYALGRHGYISMNLVTDRKLIGQYKAAARTLLANLDFNDGKRYADFDASTDKVATYGLAALVGGVAAKKLGLFAALGVFLAKFWKLIAIALFAGGGVLTKVFKRRKEGDIAA
ncbi:membrane protein [Sulfurifustis variabilis]|uniref:Membrane protein n=1 Tax=Sulfurifustis variabilis TaxID=1675686 RepID=A0A1B4V1R8_9GAMM|nr:DUF2167 domain-containing protein [Sulfurifustis variabilis]BAU47436.1 membrane protein [Sulfurifustis variabilis]